MKLSFSTLGCPGWTLEQIARNAKAMGFDGVELRGIAGEHIGPNEQPRDRKRIRKLFESAGVEITGIMGYSTFTMDDPKQREESIAIAIRYLDIARDIGCPALRVFGGMLSKELDRKGNLRRVAEGLKRVTQHAEQKQVKILLETHDGWMLGEHCAAVVDAVGSPSLGVCWDVAATYFQEPIQKTWSFVRGRTWHVQLKDAGKENGEAKSRLPGEGEVDLRSALKLLHASGYTGYLSFEWEKKWVPSLAEPEVAFPHYISFCEGLMQELGVPRG
jgi:sugar phosphate isomerase/epimerase